MRIKIYDTTLRDGAQGEGISFSLEDKLKIAQKLDRLGIDYIEGGWPASNPKDMLFFQRARDLDFKVAKVAAFGSTRRANIRVEGDPNIKGLLDSKAPAVTIFGKSWDFHVREILEVSPEENLEMIAESVSYLKSRGREVIFDAEHFFDGYFSDPTYALETLQAAAEAGADVIVLCDTNGGTLTSRLVEVVDVVRGRLDCELGIHAHNDSDLAVANTLAAVERGVTHVQGSINGYGERCGNADLCSVIPNLRLKLGLECIPNGRLHFLTEVSRYVSEIANLAPREAAPFVGNSAFAHKGGVHVSAIRKNPRSYEHVDPEAVGNRRRVLISDLSGKGNIVYKAQEFGLELKRDSEETRQILSTLKELEHHGYQFEGAEGSFEILIKKSLGLPTDFFDLEGFRVIIEKHGDEHPVSEATIKVQVKGVAEHTAAEGDGPVNALDNALRKALEEFFPQLKGMHLSDYKVRVLEGGKGTAAKVRVLIESTDGVDQWGTVGVSENIIEASWQALVDSISYKLMKDQKGEGQPGHGRAR